MTQEGIIQKVFRTLTESEKYKDTIFAEDVQELQEELIEGIRKYTTSDGKIWSYYLIGETKE